jgi:hypothetical protein
MANNSLELRDKLGVNAKSGAQNATTALPVNPDRTAFQIQNQGTNVMYVLFGTGASSSAYHFILKGGSSAEDGTGGSVSMMSGNVWRGLVTVAGTGLSYSVIEL